MGLLDKLKAAKNYVTGGGAKLTIEVGEAHLGGTTPVVVRAEVADSQLSVSRIYVSVSAEEYIDVVHRDLDDGDRDRVRKDYETFSQDFVIHGPVTLEPKSQHEWTGQIALPANAQPTYMGRHCRHVWSFRAALDVKGNDPDSGWSEVHVR